MSKRFSLTKSEAEVLLSIFDKKETLVEKGTVVVSKDGNQITFKGNGRLSILDALVINTNDTTAIFKESKLEFYHSEMLAHTKTLSPHGDTLQTIYPFTGPLGVTGLLPTGNKYTLLVARLSNTEKTYLYLKTQEKFDPERPFDQFYSIILE